MSLVLVTICVEISIQHIDLLPYDSSSCKALLYQQVIDLLRKEYKIQIDVYPDQNDSVDNEWRWRLQPLSKEREIFFKDKATTELIIYEDYYQALDKAIEKTLEIINDLSSFKAENCPEH